MIPFHNINNKLHRTSAYFHDTFDDKQKTTNFLILNKSSEKNTTYFIHSYRLLNVYLC